MVDPVPAPRCAADHVKKTVQFVLEALLGREVILEKLDGPLPRQPSMAANYGARLGLAGATTTPVGCGAPRAISGRKDVLP